MPENKKIKQSDEIIRYSINGNGYDEITFWSDDERLFGMVSDYIKNVIDAMNYRRQLQRIKGERL